MIRRIERIVFPPRCVLCDELLEQEEFGIHEKCEELLFYVEGDTCLHCGRPVGSRDEFCPDCAAKNRRDGFLGSFRQGKALLVYRGQIKQGMYRFKYSNRREYAEWFAGLAKERVGEWLGRIEPEAIVPVPMYQKKQKKRGYNQAEVFAKALSQIMSIPCDAQLISRVRDTTPQKELNDVERKNNLKNAFQMRANIVKYKKVLVVDDIYTTGNTADAVTECLHGAGISEVYFLSICTGSIFGEEKS